MAFIAPHNNIYYLAYILQGSLSYLNGRLKLIFTQINELPNFDFVFISLMNSSVLHVTLLVSLARMNTERYCSGSAAIKI